MALDALLTHCRLADGRLVDIGIAGGRIATVGEDASTLRSPARNKSANPSSEPLLRYFVAAEASSAGRSPYSRSPAWQSLPVAGLPPANFAGVGCWSAPAFFGASAVSGTQTLWWRQKDSNPRSSGEGATIVETSH